MPPIGRHFELKIMLKNIKLKNCMLSLVGSLILAFGLYNIHSVSGVTEGGALGAALLFKQLWGISPAVSAFIMNVIFYSFGAKTKGREFIIYSAVSTVGYCGFYKIFECFEPLGKNLYNMPLAAAVLGALFVGLGVGLCVRMGGAPTGDDALAMSLSSLLKIKIQWVYLISDLLVLGLSLIYIPISRIVYSLITVIISGQLIGLLQPKGEKN